MYYVVNRYQIERSPMPVESLRRPRATRRGAFAVVVTLVAVVLATTLAASPQQVLGDAGEAPYGTSTQSLEAAISLGDTHTCVIVLGNVLCWGDNQFGQLGNGQSNLGGTLYSTSPVYVKDSSASPTTNLSGVIAIAAGGMHTCALINTGKVKCWGYIRENLLGRHATFQHATQPYPEFVKSAFTDATSLGTSTDLTGVVSISTATYGSCALLSDGKVKCWGEGGGHEGSGVGYVMQCSTPSMTAGCGTTNGQPLSGIKALNMAGQTSCGIKSDDSMVCWGADNGMFADASYTGANSLYPKNAGSTVNGAKAFGTAQYSQCGLYQTGTSNLATAGGTIKCWGQNNSGELGGGPTPASRASAAAISITNAIAVAGQERSYCALLITTSVKCWGSNMGGMFATGLGDASLSTPTQMLLSGSAITGVSAISLGTSHVCLIMALDGAVRCSGSNTRGQLGDGTITTRGVPTSVSGGEAGSGSLAGAGAEEQPPAFDGAAVSTDGTKIVLTYLEPLASNNLPDTLSFEVKVGGERKTISSVTVSGSTIELNMARRIPPSAAVLMSYTDPTTSDDVAAIQDVSYNDAGTIPERSVTNSSTADATSPTLVSAAVTTDGLKLVLTYSEALGSTTTAGSSFIVTVGGLTRSVSSVAVSGSTVELTLSSAVLAGASVTVAYNAPSYDVATSNAAIQDTTGNDADAFASNAVAVTNSSTFDNVAPTFVSAAVNGAKTKVVLTYNETLGATTAAGSAFTVTVNTVSRSVTSVAVNGSTVELTLASSVNPGETVTVAYLAPASNSGTSNSAVQDVAGNDAASISPAQSVANVTDLTAPTWVSAAVDTSGSTLVLTYSEALNSTTALASAFTVTAGSVARTVSGVSVVGSTIELTLTPVIQVGQAVTVVYAAPATNSATSNNAIQDSAGNDAAGQTLVASDVTNNSTTDTVSPLFVRASVNSLGRVQLTYDENLSGTTAAVSAFVVTINGSPATVVSVSASGTTVTLVTSPLAGAGQSVTVRYDDPTGGNDTNAIQDSAGNDVVSISPASSVASDRNQSTLDYTAPTVGGSEVDNGGRLVITFGETLATPGPESSDFTVTINGSTATIVKVEVVDNKLIITTSPAIAGGETVTWTYTDPTNGTDPKSIRDSAGNELPTTSSGAGSVTNGSTVTKTNTSSSSGSSSDDKAPTITSSDVNDSGKLVITFNENLAIPGPDTTQIVVTVDGSTVTVVSVEVVDNKLVVTTSPMIASGQNVTWSYKDPTSGNDSKAIQDGSGNDFGGSLEGSGKITNGSKLNVSETESGDDRKVGTFSDEVNLDGTSGTATFGDGSQISISGKYLKIRLKTGYIGTASGTVKATYLVGSKKTSYVCNVASFGRVAPIPGAKRLYPSKTFGLWFKKVFYKPKTPCAMPAAMQTAMKTQKIVLTVKLNFKRLWPTTAKAIDDEGKVIRPAKRTMKLRVGKAIV